MESTGRFLEVGLVELNGGGGERGGMAWGWKPRGSWVGVILTTNLYDRCMVHGKSPPNC